MTYGKGGGTLPTTVGIATGAALPVTGATNSWVVAIAVAIAAGLVAWGMIYAIKNRVR
jgi:LPXTG-motif cell wall-anchored protein